MTTLQKIKELLELGYEVEVEDREKYKCIIFDYRQEILSYERGDCVITSTGHEFENFKILRIIPKKPKLLEAGRKVKVVGTGGIYSISKIHNQKYIVYGSGEASGISFNFNEVIPVYDEEEYNIDVIIIDERTPIGKVETKTYNKSEFEQAIKDLKEIK